MRLFILLLICICLALPVRAEELTAEDWAILADSPVPASVSDLEIAAPSAILVERETGAVIYEKNAHERLAPASVTKVMTLLLLAEAIDRGDLKMEDTVTCSAAASSMGGSQVYLKEGEQLPVKELLKCVVVASANDAAVALAEHLAGTESAFVALMNRRAKELGMADTVFSNCTGLPAQSEHLSSAADIAAMARELLSHSWIKDFTTIWTDSIRDGQFGLTNTNKLIRFYPGATGLKTGYTDTAGHCLAASALRDGVEYIAVVLHCASSQERFESAKALLSFAFANYTLVPCLPDQVLPPVPVKMGKADFVQPVWEGEAKALVRREKAGSIEKTVELAESVEAPVEPGEVLGRVTLRLEGETVCTLPLVAAAGAERLGYWDIFARLLGCLF